MLRSLCFETAPIRALPTLDGMTIAELSNHKDGSELTFEVLERALKRRFPQLNSPHKEDICYATTNRQEAVKAIAPGTDAMFVIGATNSSNSMRLVEVAKRAGAKSATLIRRANDIDWNLLNGVRIVGLSAGASAPEILIDEVIAAFRDRYDVTLREVAVTREDVEFKLPRALAG